MFAHVHMCVFSNLGFFDQYAIGVALMEFLDKA